jgi:isoquinoline 1-oxidoreductase beta subunit
LQDLRNPILFSYKASRRHWRDKKDGGFRAVYRDGRVEAWAPTQSPQGARDAIAAAVGAKKEDVTVHVTLLGGAFGRKSFPDFAVEAAVLSKKTGKPVKVVWVWL